MCVHKSVHMCLYEVCISVQVFLSVCLCVCVCVCVCVWRGFKNRPHGWQIWLTVNVVPILECDILYACGCLCAHEHV